MVVPKVSMLEYMDVASDAANPPIVETAEFQICWRRGLSFSNMNNDYLGPTAQAVVGMYREFLDR
jgi:hypothetical protein